jgi:hypothetical protein
MFYFKEGEMKVFRFDNLTVEGNNFGKPYHFVPVPESETFVEAISFYLSFEYKVFEVTDVTYSRAVRVGKAVV